MLVIDKIRKRIEFEKWLKNYPKECLEDYLRIKMELRVLFSKLQVRAFAYDSKVNCYYRNYEQFSEYHLDNVRYDIDMLGEEINWIDNDIRFCIREYILYLEYV